MKYNSTVLSAFAVVLIASALTSVFPLIAGSATTACPTSSDTIHGVTYQISVTGADGSCPVRYADSSHIVHYALSTSSAQNPYAVSIAATVGCSSICPPSELYVNGWAHGTIFCGSTSGITCTGTGPWKGQVDATVQAGKVCDTAPVFVKFLGTHPPQSNVLILEAGTGGVCQSTSTTSSSSTTSSTTTTSTTSSSSTTSKTTTTSTTTSTTSKTKCEC